MRKHCLTFFPLFCLFFAGSVSAQDSDPYLFVLGVAQDAGYPQAGCYAEHCLPGWEDPSLRRGATSIALVIPRANKNFLFDASPDLPEQLYRLRNEADYSLAGVFLTHAHIGHYTGLIYFGREAMGARGIPVYAMPRMHNFLENNGPWDQLVRLTNIRLRMMQDQRSVAVPQAAVTPFLVPHRDEYSETVGFRIQGPNRTALFIPDINKWEDWDTDIAQLVTEVDYALLDATFYADGELGNRDMSQIPHPFATESMALFENLSAADKSKVWFIHFNHTNPLLNPDSEESQFVREQGYNIATEGIKLPL
ncbi:MAG: MBL fold metallo-hydrolase [Pseudomonadales bacterium]|nr:MBL fold metallo-hydrolase [Pseudomonadales bacterium]